MIATYSQTKGNPIMEATGINYLAVIVATAAYWIIGALWFSPALFFNQWLRAIGKTKEQVKADFSPMNYIWALIAAFLASYGIARVCDWGGAATIVDGALVGVLAAACFVLPYVLVTDVFEKRPRSLAMINLFYHAVGLIVAGIIIGAWR
ncbi:DUF1761 family protein [candidate division GN15 bacterium]|nr:DUF1761 family protein [candidate division GN15 bacterium]